MKASPVKSTDECVDLIKHLDGESDRGFILVVGAILDEMLRTLIAKNLVDNDAVRERLLGFEGPLGSFGARVDVAFGLGLIAKATRDAVTAVGRIRNVHAHDLCQEPFNEATSAKIRSAAQLIGVRSDGPVRLLLGTLVAKLLMTLCASADASEYAKPLPEPNVDIDALLREAGHKVD